MRKAFFLLLTILLPAISYSQTTGRDSTAIRELDAICNNKYFEKCEIPVDFKYGKKSTEDSITNYLKRNNSPFQIGKATFFFIVAKNSAIYDVEKISGQISCENMVIRALQQSPDLWTIGKQNSRLICSYVRLEVQLLEDRVKLRLL